MLIILLLVDIPQLEMSIISILPSKNLLPPRMTIHSNKRNDGFALVIALSLMAFVLLLILSMVTLIQVETEQSARNTKIQSARQNALLGLNIALADLQKTAGPDARITATADILSDRATIADSQKLVTGVWKSNDIANQIDANLSATDIHKWSVRKGANNSTAQDAATGINALTWENGPEWLLSSEQPITSLDTLDLESINPSLGTVALLRTKQRLATGRPGVITIETEAGVVPILDAGATTGGYAWWIGDEGVKIKINSNESFAPAGTTEEDLLALANNFSPAFNQWTELSLSDDDWKEDLSKYFDTSNILSSTSYSPTQKEEKIIELADHWTAHSFGVLSNVRDGGLKKDLSRGLGDQFDTTLAGRPMWWVRTNSDYYLKGGLWDVAQSYANSYRPYPLWLAGFGDGSAPAEDQVGDYNSTSNYYYIKNINNDGPAGFTDPTDNSTAFEPRGPGPFATTNTQFVPSEDTASTYANATRWLYMSGPGASDAGLHNPIHNQETSVNVNNKRQQPIQHVIAPVVLGTVAELALSSATAADLWDLNFSDANGDHAYWTRERILTNLSISATPAALTKYYKQLNTSDPAESALADALRDNLALHVIVRPYAMVWNPYNVSLNDFEVEIRWFSGHVNKNSVPNLAEYDFAILDGSGNPLTFNVPSDKPSRDSAANFADSEALLLGSLTRRKEKQSRLDLVGMDPYNVLNLKIESDTPIAPGQIQMFAMDGIAEPKTGGNVLVSSASNPSTTLNGIVSAALPHKTLIPRGTPISGISYHVQARSEYDTDTSWGIDLYMSDVNGDSANERIANAGNTRARAIAASIPSLDSQAGTSGRRTVRRLFNSATNIEDLSPAGAAVDGLAYNRSGNELLNNADRYLDIVDDVSFRGVQVLGYLASLSLPADRPASEGLPLFAQFNPAAQAFLQVTDNNPDGFLWSTEVYDPSSAFVTPGIENMINGVPRWGNEFGPGGQDNIIVYDIPRYPLQSVGSLMHANLGIYDVQPTYTIGSGYASPFTEIGETYAVRSFSKASGSGSLNYYLPDASYLYNEALFDDYFFSSVPDESSARDNNTTPPFNQEFDETYLLAGGQLPNPRIVPTVRTVSMTELSDFDTAAAHLMVDGAFNVNSTSALAWKALLGHLQTVNIPGINLNDEFPLLRFGDNAQDRATDINSSWSGFRALSSAELDTLATSIVEQVRERGPFVSMADFVNRRLEDTDLGNRSALQAALDDTVNTTSPGLTQPAQYNPHDDWTGTFRTQALASDQSAGNTGWLLQPDLLKTLAPVLTPRSDTFTIRSYGNTLNPITGQANGEAWCEAIVQRYPEYIDDSPSEEPAYIKTWQNDKWKYTSNNNAALSQAARTYGRKFKIISFRWLTKDEL
ncbi:Unannotated [Lentimonas sp. CC19]|nr:Unannotated [Lentimonas sp. CC19]CAA6697306.1 Unannotated [Lentimonas sp. CC10]CAA7070418.1 Unannotated [Lentimonas sp. CC11]